MEEEGDEEKGEERREKVSKLSFTKVCDGLRGIGM